MSWCDGPGTLKNEAGSAQLNNYTFILSYPVTLFTSCVSTDFRILFSLWLTTSGYYLYASKNMCQEHRLLQIYTLRLKHNPEK